MLGKILICGNSQRLLVGVLIATSILENHLALFYTAEHWLPFYAVWTQQFLQLSSFTLKPIFPRAAFLRVWSRDPETFEGNPWGQNHFHNLFERHYLTFSLLSHKYTKEFFRGCMMWNSNRVNAEADMGTQLFTMKQTFKRLSRSSHCGAMWLAASLQCQITGSIPSPVAVG